MLCASATFAGKSVMFSGLSSSGDTPISIEYGVSAPDLAIGGSEATLGWTGGVGSENKLNMGIGYYAGKGILKASGGVTGNYFTEEGEVRFGVYGAATLDLNEEVFLLAKYTDVFDSRGLEGWQFGFGVRF